MSEGVDYLSRPGGAALAAAGKRFAVRYLYYPGATKPTLTAAEKTDLLNHGIAIALVMEVYADDCYRGWAWGAQLGQWAKASAAALGFGGLPVYFAVDRDVNVGQRDWDPNRSAYLRAYLDGAASEIGRDRTGVYGGFYVVEWAMANGLARWGWQTYAWSGGKLSSRAHIYQYNNFASVNGVPVDLDRSLRVDFGQYPRPSGDYVPPPTKPEIPDTAMDGPVRADGDLGVKYEKVDYNRVLKPRKPVRKGIAVTSAVWKTYLLRKTLHIIGRIDSSDLPASERQFGDVLITQINVGGDPGDVFGYVKQVDIAGN